jgi:hypothetical protein
MNSPSGSSTYQLVVDGELSDRFSHLFEGMTFARINGTTVITGPVMDQAQLFGLIDRVQEVGLVLLSVAQLDPSDPTPDRSLEAGP